MDPAQKATLRKAATSGKISLSDYKAAWSRYITCVQDKGYPRPTLKTYSNGIQQPQGDILPSDKADDLDYIQKKGQGLERVWNRHRGFGGRVVYGTSRQSQSVCVS